MMMKNILELTKLKYQKDYYFEKLKALLNKLDLQS